MSTVPSGQCQAKCIAYAAALVAGGVLIGYFIGRKSQKHCLNHKVKLGCEKVADVVDVEDIGEKKSYCRCWKSEKFPLCDGSHNAHNKATGDNVGPLNIRGKPAAQ